MRINDIEYIEVTVFDVRSSTQAMEAFSMILVDKSNLTHYVPIIIGLNEARAILGELHGRLPQRPLTHALFVDLIANNIEDITGGIEEVETVDAIEEIEEIEEIETLEEV